LRGIQCPCQGEEGQQAIIPDARQNLPAQTHYKPE
jgi:hypothetical protein